MNIQKTNTTPNFNGQLIIARQPRVIAKNNEVLRTEGGDFVKTGVHTILNVLTGNEQNTLTKNITKNPNVKYFENENGDVLEIFNTPIFTTKFEDNEIHRILNQIAPQMNVEIKDTPHFVQLLKAMKEKRVDYNIKVENQKANRFMQKLEEILDRKLPLTPDQPKYLVNTKNKAYFVADFTSNDKENGTIIKYIFDTNA